MSNAVELPSLTVEELMNVGKAVLQRTIVFEMEDGSEMKRKLRFRRLTYREIATLAGIPDEKTEEYTRTIVYMASIEPKLPSMDAVAELPSGFVRHYSALILSESGKDPFLSKPSKRGPSVLR